MTNTLTVEGDLATVDLRTALTTQGSVTGPSLVTPPKITKIDRIFVAAAAEGLAAGSASFILRLGGNAVKDGEQVITIGAGGYIAPQAGSDEGPSYVTATELPDVDISCASSDTIAISAEMAGQDLGTAHVVTTLFFA